MALATRGIGAQRNANFLAQQALRRDPVTRVIATDKGAVTDRRQQLQLGAKYDNNGNAGLVGRFDRAQARVAGRTAGTRAEQAATARNNYIIGMANRGTMGGMLGGAGGLSSGFGGVLGGYNWKRDYKGNVTQQFSSGPRMR